MTIKKLDNENILEKDRESAKRICNSLKITEDNKIHTGSLKSSISDEKRAESHNRVIEQQKTISNLESENEEIRRQIEKYVVLEKEYKNMSKRCVELESENLMLERRVSLITEDNTSPIIVDNNKAIELEEVSDDEFNDIEDEKLKKAFKENKVKMIALRKEIRSLVVQSTPSTTDIRTKEGIKRIKEGGYDYCEEIE